RDEPGGISRYVHFGTGNYDAATARLYEDLGVLTADPVLASDASTLFNELTGAATTRRYAELIVSPHSLRDHFTALVRREAEHARAGRPSGIRAKLNQLEDTRMIAELYRAGRAGVPISLNVRGLCCLRAGVPGLSDSIRVYSTLGRFLEHGRIYRFENGGEPEFFLGSADLMERNLDRRVESMVPVKDAAIQAELEEILETLEQDNSSAWDMQPDGTYRRCVPAPGEPRRPAQQVFLERAHAS
ncbi:MAG: RNA degradosome polyphosphate kinase, partial [Actinobacteria bacterium]